MATHLADVSVLFSAPAEPTDARGQERFRSTGGNRSAGPASTPIVGRKTVDLVPFRVSVGQGSMVTADSAVTHDVAAGRLVRVPDVILSFEDEARAGLAAAGLSPGRRDPAPRPATGRAEVVIRTHPRVGSLVLAGSSVDYELLPGERFARAGSGADVDDTRDRHGRRPAQVRA